MPLVLSKKYNISRRLTVDKASQIKSMNGITTIDSITKSSPPPSKGILSIIGNWGPWQRRNVLLIFLCKIPAAWFMACIIFTAPFAKTTEFMCNETLNGDTIGNSTESNGNSYLTIESVDSEYDVCDLVFRINDQNEQFNELHMQTNATIACNQIRHDSIFDSLVTSFDLICSRTIIIAVTQFFHLCGVLSGGILATKLLETYGLFLLFLFTRITISYVVFIQFASFTDSFPSICLVHFICLVSFTLPIC